MVQRALVLIQLAALHAGACRGPALHLDNPEGHAVFVDGAASRGPGGVSGTTLPFRYYGTMRWDAVPAPRGNRPDWEHRPTSGTVALAPALTGWLFPLDFPVDLVSWLLHGPGDTATTITVAPTPPAALATENSAEINADGLRERARQARIAR